MRRPPRIWVILALCAALALRIAFPPVVFAPERDAVASEPADVPSVPVR